MRPSEGCQAPSVTPQLQLTPQSLVNCHSAHRARSLREVPNCTVPPAPSSLQPPQSPGHTDRQRASDPRRSGSQGLAAEGPLLAPPRPTSPFTAGVPEKPQEGERPPAPRPPPTAGLPQASADPRAPDLAQPLG